mmetsp:Transcript_32878/g.129094  ORF Transcript_32878/g.129094 Transcript_32878/m.129094 type:complete len:103 (+) Transcript_32878:1202-1510(+)
MHQKSNSSSCGHAVMYLHSRAPADREGLVQETSSRPFAEELLVPEKELHGQAEEKDPNPNTQPYGFDSNRAISNAIPPSHASVATDLVSSLPPSAGSLWVRI